MNTPKRIEANRMSIIQEIVKLKEKPKQKLTLFEKTLTKKEKAINELIDC